MRDQLALFEAFPDHAKVYPLIKIPDQPKEEKKLALASFHLLHYAVIDRHVYSPHLFAFVGQQPIHYKTPPIAFHSSAERFPPLDKVPWDKVFANYEYLWCWGLPDDYRSFLQTRCTLVAASGRGTIRRVADAR